MSFSLRRRRRRLSPRQLSPDSYLTDGRNLFRVISKLVTGRSVLVWIEDCLTLEVRAHALCELQAMGLRAVGKARGHAIAAQSSTPTLAGIPTALR